MSNNQPDQNHSLINWGFIVAASVTSLLLGLVNPATLPLKYAVGFCLFLCLIVSLIIVQHYIQQSGSLTNKLCSQGKNVDCKAILDNPKAKFFSIPHADIGIVYFGGSLATLISFFVFTPANEIQTNVLPWTISLLSLIALIYSIYSLYCQKYLIKQWCSLCVLVQIFVIVQAAIILIHHKNLLFLTLENNDVLYSTSFAFFGFTAIWVAIRFFLVSQNGNVARNDAAKNTLLNKQTIKTIQQQQGAYEFEELEGDIVLHSKKKSAETSTQKQPWHVVIGIAPSCRHCGEFLDQMVSLIETEQLPIILRIRFVIFNGDDQDGINDKVVAENSIALNVKEGSEFALKSLQQWYQEFNGQELKAWEATLRKFSDEEINMTGIYLADNSFWLQEKDITETPALFIEDYEITPEHHNFAPALLRKLSGSTV